MVQLSHVIPRLPEQQHQQPSDHLLLRQWPRLLHRSLSREKGDVLLCPLQMSFHQARSTRSCALELALLTLTRTLTSFTGHLLIFLSFSASIKEFGGKVISRSC